MNTNIYIETKKELTPAQLRQLLQFKGALIEAGYTDIIHITDKDADMHLHYFELPKEHAHAILDKVSTLADEYCQDWCAVGIR